MFENVKIGVESAVSEKSNREYKRVKIVFPDGTVIYSFDNYLKHDLVEKELDELRKKVGVK